MAARISHRGPDGSGEWANAEHRVGLAHRRLAIIDLSPRGRQPMTNEDGTIWLVFNGEIYNYQSLRKDLIAKGHQFTSDTDSEVLVHLYEELGEAMLDKLNGMFAFAIYDMRQRKLMLARGPAGIKPLYYAVHQGALYFSSEMKSLMAIPGLPRELNLDVLPEYLTFLWVGGEQTMMKSVHKLEPGNLLVWQDGTMTVRYWSSMRYDQDESMTYADASQLVHDELFATVRRYMVADVPLGAFLSGGIDSSCIVACMRHSYPGRPIKSYVIRSSVAENHSDDLSEDYPHAVDVANHLAIDLKVIDAHPDMMTLLPKLVWHLDEPDADPAGILSYVICKAAREDGTTVLLSGTGGDEVFFGYRSHQAMDRYQKLRGMLGRVTSLLLGAGGALAASVLGAQSPPARRIEKFRNGLNASGLQRHIALVDWASPESRQAVYATSALKGRPDPRMHVPEFLERYARAFQGTGAINLHSHLLIQTFLSAHNFLYTDKASMAVGLEVRVPFMDLELLKLCARIPERHKLQPGRTKPLLRSAMGQYLPSSVFTRKKTGFGVPLRHWISNSLRPMVRHVLSPDRIRARGLFDPVAVARMIAEHDRKVADHAYLIYAILCLELWMQTFIDEPGLIVTI